MNFPCNFIMNVKYPPFHLDSKGLVYNQDSIKVMNNIPSNSIDLILTDPPYGINFCSKRNGRIKNDTRHKAIMLYKDFIEESARILKPGRCCCVFCFSGGKNPIFPEWVKIMQEYLEYKNTIVWDRQIIGLGAHYRNIYDFVLIGKKRGDKCIWNGKYDNSNIVKIKRIIPRNDDHPSPKPVDLMKHFIRLHSNRDDIVLDPFTGCGPTLIAASDLGRKYIGIEIEKKYCKAIVNKL